MVLLTSSSELLDIKESIRTGAKETLRQFSRII